MVSKHQNAMIIPGFGSKRRLLNPWKDPWRGSIAGGKLVTIHPSLAPKSRACRYFGVLQTASRRKENTLKNGKPFLG